MQSASKIKYVAGFIFDESGSSILLIEKNKPDWQKGKFNAIGGKIEPGETQYDAMVRETREEVGLDIYNWKEFVVLEGNGWKVHFFKSFSPKMVKYIQKESERPEIFNVKVLPKNIIDNLVWLIPMSLTKEYDSWSEPLTVKYPSEYSQ